MKDYYVSVYNTITHRYEKVEVSPEVYREYMRSEWNIRDNDKSFFSHQIQFSVMIGSAGIENFQEFMRLVKDTHEIVEEHLLLEALYKALDKLEPEERELITQLYLEGRTEREYAVELQTTQQNVHKKKHVILCKLHELIEKLLI